jgi:hypothetical protein
MSEHTSEPWREFDEARAVQIHAGDKLIFSESFDYSGDPLKPITIANAKRIVACVNACAGIPTYQLFGVNDEPNNLGAVIDSQRTNNESLREINRDLTTALANAQTEYCDQVPVGKITIKDRALLSMEPIQLDMAKDGIFNIYLHPYTDKLSTDNLENMRAAIYALQKSADENGGRPKQHVWILALAECAK